MNDLAAIPLPELRRLAGAARAQSDLRSEEALLRELIRRAPRDTDGLLELACCLENQGVRAQSLAMARRAAGIAPRDPRIQWALASSLLANGLLEPAARAYESLTRARPNDPVVLTAHGNALERLRRTAEARALAERALAAAPDHGPALNLLGRLELVGKNLDRAAELFERAIRDAKDPASQASAWHLLGSVRESQKRWDDAFEAHTRGNRVLSTTTMARHADRESAYPILARTMLEGSERIVARWAESGPRESAPPDPVFLVGFPRSGTTLTEQVLGAVKGAVTTDEEPVFTSTKNAAMRLMSGASDADAVEAIDALTDEQIGALRAEYWSSVERQIGPQAATARLFVDKQPLRFVQAALMNRLFPRARIVFVIRDPRDCCLSCYFQGFAPTGPMARATTLEGIGELYGEVFTFWLRARTRLSMPVLEVRYEDMVTDFETHARRLIEFVGHTWSDDILRFNEKASARAIRTPSYQAVTEKVNTRAVGKWANYEKHLGPLIERVRPFLAPLGYEE